MSRPKNRRQRASSRRRGTRVQTRVKTGNRAAPISSDPSGQEPPDLDVLWASLRQGARNVAGVTFQVAVTADLLVAGRARPPNFPRIARVVPEGFEDIDCVLQDDRRLLVQTKERGPGS